MNWFTKFLTSSIGKKLIMSMTGLFLIIFLIIHLLGNLLLLVDDGGESFNTYAYFMTTNPLIKTVSIGLYFFILLHAVQGIYIAWQNWRANPVKYAVNGKSSSWISNNMAILGLLVFAFLCLHMGDFWFKMKFTDQLAMINVSGVDVQVKDLYSRVYYAFHQEWIVVVYLIGLFALALHLYHGFQSALQTLGWNHTKYTPIIKAVGYFYAIVVPLAFAAIPVILYFR